MDKAPPRRKTGRANAILGAVLLVLTGVVAWWVFAGGGETEVPAEEWVEWQSPDGLYTASFPVRPDSQRATRELPEVDVTLEFHLDVTDLPSRAYAVGWTDYPIDFVSRSRPEEILDDAMERGARDIEGKLTDRRDIELDGHPGREFVIESPTGGRGHFRIILVGPRLYQLAVMYDEAFEPRTDFFFDSFRLSG